MQLTNFLAISAIVAALPLTPMQKSALIEAGILGTGVLAISGTGAAIGTSIVLDRKLKKQEKEDISLKQ